MSALVVTLISLRVGVQLLCHSNIGTQCVQCVCVLCMHLHMCMSACLCSNIGTQCVQCVCVLCMHLHMCMSACLCTFLKPLPPLPPSLPLFLPPSLSLSQVRDSTWRLGSCSVVVAMENHTEPRVEGVDQRLEETSCGWRLWISSGTLTASLAL